MGIKKYEIITVGSNKRVRALRSWQVGDRYVNIGDVGGIVYDEKTLSQDGACWLFRGNFGFPGARIGGDSIVDVGEAAPDAAGSANLDILGTSTVVGAPVKFTVGLGAVDGRVLSAADFEQGAFANYATGRVPGTSDSANFIRTKNPIFMGGVAATLKLDVPGYRVLALVLDRDGFVITGTSEKASGVGVTLAVPAGQYFVLRVTKDPMADIVPGDATAARISTTTIFEAKLVVVDSRLELNPANGTGTITIRSGGVYSPIPGAKYPDSVIRGSKVVINSRATEGRDVRLVTELVNTNATISATEANAQAVGIYHGVNNVVFTGTTSSSWDEPARSSIQAYDCDNMVVSPKNFPGLVAMQTAGVPIRFYKCNLNNGRFYHHAKIANTYRDINFDLATAYLGKATANGYIMVSSEVQGMYRMYSETLKIYGVLVESHESINGWLVTSAVNSYNTTIYKDAYVRGLWEFAGTNVFGRTRSHDNIEELNLAGRVVQGMFNNVQVGTTITAITPASDRLCIPVPIRSSGSIVAEVRTPANIESQILSINAQGVILGASSWAKVDPATGYRTVTSESGAPYVGSDKYYIAFRIANGTPISVSDLGDGAVRLYRGCKIVNTGGTTLSIKGNVRVEDDAHVLDTSITGTGYFGGFSTIQGATIVGCAYMKDRAVCAIPNARTFAGLRMTDNSLFIGDAADTTNNLVLSMSDNAKVYSPGRVNVAFGRVRMEGDSALTGGALASASTGEILMKDKASISGGSTTFTGDITLCGSYTQSSGAKTWIGKRVIFDVNTPEFSNNVHTQYDF